MRILALADLQLGAGRHLAPDRLHDQERMLAAVADTAAAERCEAVLIAGDVYEDRHPTREEDEVFASFLGALHERGIPAFCVLGNHDFRGFERASTVSLFRRLGLDVIDRPTVRSLGDVAVACLPWIAPGHLLASRNGGGDRDQVNAEVTDLLLRTAADLRAAISPDLPAILVTHWWLEGAGTVPRELVREPVLPLADLAALGYDLVIGGHVHDPAVLHTAPPVVMLGSPYVCSWGETQTQHGVWIIDTDKLRDPHAVGGHPGVTFLPLDDRPFQTLDIEPGDLEDLDSFADIGFAGRALSEASVRVRATVTAEQRRRIDEPALRRALADAGAVTVDLQLDTIREDRARVASIADWPDPIDQLSVYCEHHGIDHETTETMAETLDAWLDDLGDGQRITGGGLAPVRLELENWGPFERATLDYAAGVVAVVGDNGAGKTTLLRAPELLLYARPGELRAHHRADAVDPLVGTLTFEAGGETYRVRRTYTATARGKQTLDLERRAPSDGYAGQDGAAYWKPLTRDSVAETQALLESIVGVSRPAFAHAVYGSLDGQAFADPSLGDADRKRIVIDAVVPAVWGPLAERAKTERKTVDGDLIRLEGETTALRDLADTVPDLEARARSCDAEVATAKELAGGFEAELTAAVDQLREHEAWLAQAREAQDAAALAREKADTLAKIDQAAEEAREQTALVEQETERLEPVAATVDALAEEEASLRTATDAHAARVREHEAAVREADTKKAQRQAIEAQAREMRVQAERMATDAREREEAGPGSQTCRECQQTLGAEALASAVAHIRTQANDLVEAARDLDAQAEAIQVPDPGPAPEAPLTSTADLAAATQRLREARDAATQLKVLAERKTTLAQTIARGQTPEHRAAVAEASKTLTEANARLVALEQTTPEGDPAMLAGNVETLRDRLTNARQTIVETEAQAAVAHERLARARDATTKLAEADQRRETLNAQADLLAQLERACGRDGIPTLLLEAVAVPTIEDETTRILRRLGGETAHATFELRTQADLRSGDGVKETFGAVMHFPDGERAYRLCSTGEQAKIGIALRRALARLVPGVHLMVLDDIEGLSETGLAALVDLLRDEASGWGPVYVASHHPALRDAIDDTLHVERDQAGASRLAERETVAA